MWSTNKRDRCLRSGLLTVNCAACVTIVYIYITYMGKKESIQGILSENIIQPGQRNSDILRCMDADCLKEKLIAEKCTPVCDSRACVWHANLLLRNVNTTADPCENFHSFLCNGFRAKFGPDEIGNVRTETKGPMLSRLKGILNNIEADPESASGKMKIVYDSCVNYGSSELHAIADVKNFLNTIGILNWPNLPPDFSFNGISLPTILGNFIAFGAEYYYLLIQVVGNETQQDRLQVELQGLSFKKATEVPRELAVSMLKYFDLETKDIDAIIDDHERVRNSIINLTEDFGCLNETCSEVSVNCSKQHDDDWNEFCETLRFVLNFMNVGEQYDINTIKIEKPGDMFHKSLYPILHSFSNRSLANFVALSFLKGYQGEMNFYFRLSKLKHIDFTGYSEKERYELNRWKYCVRWIADRMKLSLGNEFFHQFLTNPVTEEIVNLYHAYLSDLIEIVTLQEWIPTEAKSYLVEELKNTTFNIEILRRILPNDTYINKVYEGFHPTKESFFNNAIGLKKILMDIISPIDLSNREKFALHTTDFDVQASAGILLEVHFGMLLPPFYVSGHISLINRILLALIGHEFGHNIFHTLEDLLENNEKLLQKKQCIEEQFSIFKYENLNEYLNGSRFLDENMADNVETTLIDKVIERHSASQDIILPGLPYSTKQLLYMSASQMWCSKSNLEKDLLHKNLDYHAPHEFRLLGMMQNSRGHPEAFHCPEGSFMNPETKCSLLDPYKN